MLRLLLARTLRRLPALLVLLFVLPSTASPPPPLAAPQRTTLDLRAVPLAFAANTGQVDPAVRFLAHLPQGVLFFTPNQIVLTLQGLECGAAGADCGAAIDHIPQCAVVRGGRAAPPPPGVLRLRFEDALPTATLRAGLPLAGQVNYFVGNDPARWRANVPTYERLTYEGLYPYIDLRYEGTGARLKGTYVVAPGGAPADIHWYYEGADTVQLDAAGNLQIRLAGSGYRVTEEAPVAWQEQNGRRTPVTIRYALDDEGGVGFELGSYNPLLPLVIDPTLAYATYLGGGGADSGWAVTVDAAGNAYVTGATLSINFPTQNPYQSQFGGGYNDIFVTKLNAAGTGLIYSTYLGGGGEDMGLGIFVDGAGNAYLAGSTGSLDFPLLNPVQATYGGGNVDAFVLELNPTGDALLYSTYLGGSHDDCSVGVARLGNGTLYTGGYTGSTNYPVVQAIQPASGGDWDAFVTKLNPAGTALLYSTYLGGSDYEFTGGFAVDGAGNAYISGITESANFPVVAAVQPALGGEEDAFLAKVNPDGTALVYSTYLGGSAHDEASIVAVDAAGNAYLNGVTHSPNFPLHNPFQAVYGGQGDAFVVKLPPAGSPLVFSTYLGGSGAEWGHGVVADGAGNIYVDGNTASLDFPLINPLQPTYGGGTGDVFLARLPPTGQVPHYATYLGGSGDEGGMFTTLDSAGNAYVTGWTNSPNFPTRNAYQPVHGGDSDVFVVKVLPALESTPSVTPALPTPTLNPPSPTPSPCAITFQDVPAGHPFYPFVQCLACRGILNGYADGTFRPGASITRGQVAKILAGAAQLNEPIPPAQATFADVPPTQPFWVWIERLAGRGILNGYGCGGPGEPCDGQNRPYFRPGADITRSQLAKVVANSVGYADPIPPGRQTFADVPASHPFRLWVERVALHDIISGYSCGGAGEPCDEQNRPYFRPAAGATRSQTAKIVAQTFFPGCETP